MEDIFIIICFEEHRDAYSEKMTYVNEALNNNDNIKCLLEFCGYKKAVIFLDSENAQNKIFDGSINKTGDIGAIYVDEDLSGFDIAVSVYNAIYITLINDNCPVSYAPKDFQCDLLSNSLEKSTPKSSHQFFKETKKITELKKTPLFFAAKETKKMMTPNPVFALHDCAPYMVPFQLCSN